MSLVWVVLKWFHVGPQTLRVQFKRWLQGEFSSCWRRQLGRLLETSSDESCISKLSRFVNRVTLPSQKARTHGFDQLFSGNAGEGFRVKTGIVELDEMLRGG